MEFSKILGERKSDGGFLFLIDLRVMKKKFPPLIMHLRKVLPKKKENTSAAFLRVGCPYLYTVFKG